jgi:transposase-like protein
MAMSRTPVPYRRLTMQQFMTAHATQGQCLVAIVAKRWPAGWVCPHCGSRRYYQLRSRRALQCANRWCRKQVSITAGTLFDQLKLPLPKVFAAIALMTDKQGISAEALRKAIGCAYDTAFALLHRLRRAMAERDVVYALQGDLEVDDAYLGGHGDGHHRGGRARDTKRVIGVAVERCGNDCSGFIHLEPLPAANAESLHGMILERVRQGAQIFTDQWRGYCGLGEKGYVHRPRPSPDISRK